MEAALLGSAASGGANGAVGCVYCARDVEAALLGSAASRPSALRSRRPRSGRDQAAPRALSSGGAMGDAAWQHEFAEQLLDEHPSSYKPIDVVMRDQADLVEVVYELRGIANYKGTS